MTHSGRYLAAQFEAPGEIVATAYLDIVEFPAKLEPRGEVWMIADPDVRDFEAIRDLLIIGPGGSWIAILEWRANGRTSEMQRVYHCGESERAITVGLHGKRHSSRRATRESPPKEQAAAADSSG